MCGIKTILKPYNLGLDQFDPSKKNYLNPEVPPSPVFMN
jgi:hypothetical protein